MTRRLAAGWREIWRHPIGGYAGAIVLCVAAAVLQGAVQPWTGATLPFVFFSPVLIAAGLLGGVGPGLVSLAASGLLAATFPRVLGDPGPAPNAMNLLLFLGVGGALLYATATARRIRARLETEVAHRQELLDRLQERERDRHLLAAIVSSSDDAIVSKDLEGRITSWNAAAQRLFGYTESEAVGESIAMLYPDDRQEDFRNILDHIRRGERVEHYETRRRRRDGTVIDVSLTVSPIHDESGRIVGASKICRDITAAKAAEREARRTRDLYLGMLGHELRNPLNTLVASLYSLEKHAPDSTRPILARMSRATDRMTRMIAQLLDFTRARLGEGIPVKPVPDDLSRICAAVVEELEASHPKRFRFSTAGEVRGLWDPDRLSQVVSNLLDNAIAHGASTDRVEVRLAAARGEASLEVRNQGAQIPQDCLARIFEPFNRGRTAGDSNGLGLGLYIVREVVRSHGGTIQVASGESGTTFLLRLPVNEVSEPVG